MSVIGLDYQLESIVKNFLELEEKNFEFNKQKYSEERLLNEKMASSSDRMVNTIQEFVESIQNTNKAIEVMVGNQNALYNKLVEIEEKLDEVKKAE